MRHDPNLALAKTRTDRFARLFALHGQSARQSAPEAAHDGEVRVPSPSFARLFQARALVSLEARSEDADTQAMVETLTDLRE